MLSSYKRITRSSALEFLDKCTGSWTNGGDRFNSAKRLDEGGDALLVIVSISTFNRWCLDAKSGKKNQNRKGGQHLAVRESVYG